MEAALTDGIGDERYVARKLFLDILRGAKNNRVAHIPLDGNRR